MMYIFIEAKLGNIYAIFSSVYKADLYKNYARHFIHLVLFFHFLHPRFSFMQGYVVFLLRSNN